jgi:hypothetical protein
MTKLNRITLLSATLIAGVAVPALATTATVPLNLVPAPTQPPPPSASACSAPLPSDVTNAGYTTIAKCDDFTAALPNTLGTGLPGGNCTGPDPSTCPANNWLGVESGPFDGQSHEWFIPNPID